MTPQRIKLLSGEVIATTDLIAVPSTAGGYHGRPGYVDLLHPVTRERVLAAQLDDPWSTAGKRS